jgi:hypothetical protein
MRICITVKGLVRSVPKEWIFDRSAANALETGIVLEARRGEIVGRKLAIVDSSRKHRGNQRSSAQREQKIQGSFVPKLCPAARSKRKPY